MRFRNTADLYLILFITLAALLSALLGVQWPVIRTLFALPLVFLFPGYALIAALYTNRVDTATHLVGGIALSIATAGLGGLVLHFTGLGLTPVMWMVLLSAITVAAAVVALLRRGRAPMPAGAGLQLNASQILLFGAALVLVGVAVWVARDGAARQEYPGFTQLWMLPHTDASSAGASDVQIGIRNDERQTVTYRLVVTLDEDVAEEWDTISLDNGQQWTTTFAPDSEGHILEARLYRLDQTDDVYRVVSLELSR